MEEEKLIVTGALRLRCGEPTWGYCANCASRYDPREAAGTDGDCCPVCTPLRRFDYYKCVRCEGQFSNRIPGGEHPCKSVEQYRSGGHIAFEEEARAAAVERERIEAMARAAEAERRRQEEELRRRLAEAERIAEDERNRREEDARRAAAESERQRREEGERERLARKAATRRWIITGGIATLLVIIFAIVASNDRNPSVKPPASPEQINRLTQSEIERNRLEEENTKLRLEIERTRQLEETARRQREEQDEIKRAENEQLEKIRTAEKERTAKNEGDRTEATVASVQSASHVRLAIEAMIKSANDGNDGLVEDARSKLNNLQRPLHGDVETANEYNIQGLDAARRQDYENAALFFRKAVGADLSNGDLRGRLGYALLLSGRVVAAEPELVNSLGISPTNSLSWMALGITYAIIGNKEKAIGCFINALRYAGNRKFLFRYLEKLSLEARNENIRATSDSVLRRQQVWPIKRRGIVLSSKPIIDLQNHTKREYRLVVQDLLEHSSVMLDSNLQVTPESVVVVVFDQGGSTRVEPFIETKTLANELFFGDQLRNPSDNQQPDNVASDIAPADPRERCKNKSNFISRALCETRACQKPEYANHQYCEQLRQLQSDERKTSQY